MNAETAVQNSWDCNTTRPSPGTDHSALSAHGKESDIIQLGRSPVACRSRERVYQLARAAVRNELRLLDQGQSGQQWLDLSPSPHALLFAHQGRADVLQRGCSTSGWISPREGTLTLIPLHLRCPARREGREHAWRGAEQLPGIRVVDPEQALIGGRPSALLRTGFDGRFG
jgi:hypothetical protein